LAINRRVVYSNRLTRTTVLHSLSGKYLDEIGRRIRKKGRTIKENSSLYYAIFQSANMYQIVKVKKRALPVSARNSIFMRHRKCLRRIRFSG
jgi:hypothetical protein